MNESGCPSCTRVVHVLFIYNSPPAGGRTCSQLVVEVVGVGGRMWVSTLSPVCSFCPTSSFGLSVARAGPSDPLLLLPPSASLLSFWPPLSSLTVFPARFSTPTCRLHPPASGGAPSFTPVPPDRLKLQSVASPSVGTLIRGRLHCSGTLLAALGYQLFPDALSLSLSLTFSLCSLLSCSTRRLPTPLPAFHLLRFTFLILLPLSLSLRLLFSFFSPTLLDPLFLSRFFLAFSLLAPTVILFFRFFFFFHRVSLSIPDSFIGGSPYSWASAPLSDNLRVKLLRSVGIAFARTTAAPTRSVPLSFFLFFPLSLF
ncbi:uncharacterized protein LOC143211376 [Lasioglossum baleicum]|uniref:uncharacterized protein LOC143211376 n=1 Tax=Lasioglossum baleicum TaxID=434251 RepID=UPI003FCD0AF6